MNFKVSLWEHETFMRRPDAVVLGSGIVGLNAAISLKEQEPRFDVLVVDRGSYPIGASTRNAGFSCFGSVTELIDDLETSSEDEVIALLCERYHGLQFLRNRVGDHRMEYEDCGGYEVFDDGQDFSDIEAKVSYLNNLIEASSGLVKTFELRESPYQFSGLSSRVLFNNYEGCIHPGKMIQRLIQKATDLGVRFLNGALVSNISSVENGVSLEINSRTLECGKLIVCTNGLTKTISANADIDVGDDEQLAPVISKLQLKPARNQVLVTEEIPDLKLNSCFHYDAGYVYFRNIRNRVLIGGGRNLAKEEEETSDFGQTEKIRRYLMDVLVSKIGLDPSVKIDYQWSGIMGIGPVKAPIVRKHSEHIIFAVRLGGMGIALGSRIGDQAAKLLLKNTTI